MEWWPIKRAGGHIFNIFSLNWVIKLPFSAESATTFNLLFLVCMIANWDDPSRAGEQNQYFFKNTTWNRNQMQSKYTVLNIAMPSWWSSVKDDKRFICHELQCEYWIHTCKDRCLLQIRLLNVPLIPGFHISYFSWIYLLLSEGKNTKERYSYGQKIMHAGIWNVHFMFQSFRNFNINPPPPQPLKANLGHLHYWVLCSLT